MFDYWVFFVFKQKTAYEMRISDWSSDVCSSDLPGRALRQRVDRRRHLVDDHEMRPPRLVIDVADQIAALVVGEFQLGVARQPFVGALALVAAVAAAADRGADEFRADDLIQIGRASCRESVCQYV